MKIDLPDVLVVIGAAAIVAALWMCDMRLGIGSGGVALVALGFTMAMVRAKRAR